MFVQLVFAIFWQPLLPCLLSTSHLTCSCKLEIIFLAQNESVGIVISVLKMSIAKLLEQIRPGRRVLLPLWPTLECRGPWNGPRTQASHRNPRGRLAVGPPGRLARGGSVLLPLWPGPNGPRPDKLPCLSNNMLVDHQDKRVLLRSIVFVGIADRPSWMCPSFVHSGGQPCLSLVYPAMECLT